MILKNAFLTLALLSTLPGCASTSGGEGQSSYSRNGNIISPSARLYGDYVAASYANHLGDAHSRAAYYSRAFARKPEDLILGRKAMASALSAGEMPLARTLAIEVQALDAFDGLSRAILGAHAFSKTKYKQALTHFGTTDESVGMGGINALMRGWVQVGLGNTDTALTTFTELEGGKYFELIGSLQKAKLYAQLDDAKHAGALFEEIDEIGVSAIESVLSQVRFDMARGEKDKALAKLGKFAKDNDGALTGPVRLYIDAIKADKTITTKLTPAQSASRALTEPAFGYYAVQKQYEAAEMFLRLALVLDPENDKARLFLGSVLEDIERQDDAMMQYTSIEAGSPYNISARLSEASILFDKDENDVALEKLKVIHGSNPSRITQDSLGRAYLILEDYAAALPYYDTLIAGMSVQELKDNPQSRYIRGICLERLDRWQEAVTEFEFVLKHQPKNADALNYLGYTWVDKGVELTKAFSLIRQAVALQPRSGAIIDSLGWAHYKLGQYGEARIKLEDAVERSPSSATIVDHLGDVYWKLGRTREAGYQWQRALGLDPTKKEIQIIKAKLKGGLRAAASLQ